MGWAFKGFLGEGIKGRASIGVVVWCGGSISAKLYILEFVCERSSEITVLQSSTLSLSLFVLLFLYSIRVVCSLYFSSV